MKLNRKQLRKLILKEMKLLNEGTEFMTPNGTVNFSWTDKEFYDKITDVTSDMIYSPIGNTTTIIIDKTSLPNVTVDEVAKKALVNNGNDLRPHLEPMHGLKHPKYKIVEYMGAGKYVYRGKTYIAKAIEDYSYEPIPGSENWIPQELCGDRESVANGKGVRNDTTVVVLHDGKSKLNIVNPCHSDSREVFYTTDARRIRSLGSSYQWHDMYYRIIHVILGHPDLEQYRIP